MTHEKGSQNTPKASVHGYGYYGERIRITITRGTGGRGRVQEAHMWSTLVSLESVRVTPGMSE